MSGAVACLVGSDDNLYLFGVVQEVPANFSGGQLQVASLSEAFNDLSFRQHLQTVLGGASHIVPYSIEPKRSNPIDMVYSQPPPSTGSAQPIPRLPVNSFIGRRWLKPRANSRCFARASCLVRMEWVSQSLGSSPFQMGELASASPAMR